MNVLFFLNSILLGIGLAMDAFSVSMANGLAEPDMSMRKHWNIAVCFAFFQFLMPMIGWICVHSITEAFKAFQPFIPWIALILLLFIGGKMLIDGIRKKNDETQEAEHLTASTLFIQGIATSIDALSVGFTIAGYNTMMALTASIIIAVVTLAICMAGVFIGRKFGMKFADKASIFGGLILICIGIEIFVTGVF